MKNFFSNIIVKVKNFVENLTPTARLRYIAISVVTITITASLFVVISLNTSEPETPTNPEDFENGETASIDFDNEIIFEIDGESSSVSTTEVITEDSSVTTDDVNETEEPTSAEEITNLQTENNMEPIEYPYPQPTDPSHDYNPDPQPVGTTNTPVANPEPTETTTQTQTTHKPTEIITKAPQTEPKSTETINAPQTEPKPTETTKPQESTPQPTGQFSFKEKKYDYNGANVTILQVESKSQQAYTITITGKFKDANGNIVKTENKTFEGFPAGWSNYFVFQPGVKYSSVTWGIETVEFTGDTLAQYINVGTKVDTHLGAGLSDGSGRYIIPTSAEEVYKYKHYVTVYGYFVPVFSSYHNPINYTSDLIVLDKFGRIMCIDTGGASNFSHTEDSPGAQNMVLLVSNVLWENVNSYNIPDEFSGLTGIMAVKSVTEY